MRSRSCLFAFLVATWCAAGAARAVTLGLDSATIAESGQVAPVCVLLDSGGEAVAASENRIYWDVECARPVSEGCRANPEHGKMLFSRVVEADSVFYGERTDAPFVKTVLISFEESGPIADGELYCCNFVFELDAPGDCCELYVDDPLVSSPDARALDTVAGSPGFVCLDPDATPRPPIVPDTRTPTWTPSPDFDDSTRTPTPTVAPDFGPHAEEPPVVFTASPVRTATTSSSLHTPVEKEARSTGGDTEDDGCQVTDRASGTGGLVLLLAALPWWIARGPRRRAALLRVYSRERQRS